MSDFELPLMMQAEYAPMQELENRIKKIDETCKAILKIVKRQEKDMNIERYKVRFRAWYL